MCSQKANRPLLKYPAQDCEDVRKTQGDSFVNNAFAEWDRNFDDNGNEIEDFVYTGILKCYCDI